MSGSRPIVLTVKSLDIPLINVQKELRRLTLQPSVSQNDGFIEVTNRKNKDKKAVFNQPKARPVSGIRLTKPKPSFYRPVSKPVNERGGASTSGPNAHGFPSNSGPNASTPKGKASTSHAKSGGKYPSMSNSFDVLNTLAEEEECGVLKPTCTQEKEHAEENGKQEPNKGGG
ncbi:hypothetical protein Tco_1437025 [Tanacetum coccineum]